MQIIYNNNTDPCFNLAAEEYLMDHTSGDVFMLWRNAPSVIIGKNQNAWAEVNLSFAEKHGIKVVRRLTGGGAVFHDLGNVNFTFITDAQSDGIDFSRFAVPVIGYLAKLGVSAELDGRNDILVDGRKISGNAQCVRARPDGMKRLMHHGTLLYSADISDMSGALNVNREKLVTKGIASVKSRVANIRDLSPSLADVEADGFIESLISFAEGEYSVQSRSLTAEENAQIAALAADKYGTWEWNFGASPAFTNERTVRYDFGTLTVMYSAEQGKFSQIALYGDFFGNGDLAELCESLRGCRIERQAVRKRLGSIKSVDTYIHRCTSENLLDLIFGSTDEPQEKKGN